MKCQKCHAENINEAVKCGICGTRLNHPKTFNEFTGREQRESSVRREDSNPKPFNPNPNIKPKEQSNSAQNTNQTQSVVERIFDKNTKIEDKAKILLDTWQDKAKDAWENAQNQPKKKPKYNKWFFIIIAIFIFGSPVLGVITRVIIPEIQYQIREHLRIQRENEEAAATEDVNMEDVAIATATVDGIVDANEYEQRYAEMRSYEQDVERFLKKNNVLPKDLTEIEKFDDVTYSAAIHNVIKIEDGVIVGEFDLSPEKNIYLTPTIKNKKIVSWTCSKIGISDEEFADCQ